MKIRYLFILLLLSTTSFLSAQIWTSIVPHPAGTNTTSEIRVFIKTNDNGFLVLLRSTEVAEFLKTRHTMVKYNANGEIEWDKSYDFGVSIPNSNNSAGARPSKIVQLANGNYLAEGGFKENNITTFYLFLTSSLGDSLLYQTTNDNYINFQLVNEQPWTLRNQNSEQRFLVKLDEIGNPIEGIPLEDVTNNRFLIAPDEFIFTKSGNNFRKHNIAREVLIEQPSDNIPRYFTTNELRGITGFGNELTKLDADLNILWDLQYDDLFTFGPPGGFQGTDLTRTTEDDYIFTGYLFDPNDLVVGSFMYKYSKDGEYLWGDNYPYDILPTTYLHGVIEVDDGLVVVGANKFSDQILLIKFPNEDLYLTNTEDTEISTPDLHLYPNPVTDQLTLQFPTTTTGQIQLANAQGQIMTTKNISFSERHRINLQDYPTGLYLVKVMTNEGVISSQMILKQ